MKLHALTFTFAICLSLTAQAQQTAIAVGPTPEESRRTQQNQLANARQLLLNSGVPFNPDELFTPMWRIRLKETLEAMPAMHQTRYETKPLAGVYLADTLYLPEQVKFAGPVVILANHVVMEGKHPTLRAPESLVLSVLMFTRHPNETLGKPLRDTLHEAGLSMPAQGEAPPSFDELVKALGLDPYRHGKRYALVFEPVPIAINANGKPGAPGKDGCPGADGGRTAALHGNLCNGANAAFPVPTGDVPPPPPPPE